MRKLFAVLLIVTTLFFCSCGAGSDESEEQIATEAAEMMAPAMTAADEEFPKMDEKSAASGKSFSNDQLTMNVDHGFHYFTFIQNSTTYKDENNHDLLLETLTKANFFAIDPELNEWVNGIVDDIYETDVAYGQEMLTNASSSLEEIGEEQFYSFSHHVSMGVGRHDDDIISLLALSSVYSGGTNPSSVRTAYNLDLDHLRVLTLEDVIEPDGAPMLEQIVQSDVESRFGALGEDALFEDYEQMIADVMEYNDMTPNWYFNENGLVVFFNQYTLGPNMSGMIRIQIPYEELDGILLPEFFPNSYSGMAMGVKVSQEPSNVGSIYDVYMSEGETVYISIEGEAHQVQLSEVFWVDQTPVGENMLFSANQLDDSVTIAVTGDLTDTSKVYAVEYYDERGGPQIYYIQGTNVLDELPQK